MVESKGNKYDHVRLFSPEQSAGLIERALVTGERRVMTDLAWWASLGNLLFPSLIESVLGLQYRLEPEAPPNGKEASKTAAGDKDQLVKLGKLVTGLL